MGDGSHQTGTDSFPGAPGYPRLVEWQFWAKVAAGKLPRETAEAVGVLQPVGQRWFWHAGVMCLFRGRRRLTVTCR